MILRVITLSTQGARLGVVPLDERPSPHGQANPYDHFPVTCF